MPLRDGQPEIFVPAGPEKGKTEVYRSVRIRHSPDRSVPADDLTGGRIEYV